MAKLTVRRARRSDSEGFLRLLVALAEFERLEPPASEGQRRLLRDIFDRKRLGLFVAEADGALVGYALYFYTYSSFLARPTLYLEDIFVEESHRGSGAGTALFRACAREAARRRCGRMEWAVLKWNKRAVGFYEGMGASRLGEWDYYRLSGEAVGRAGSPGSGNLA